MTEGIEHATRASTDLGGRWDAEYHLARVRHAERIAKLERLVSTKDAVDRLLALPLDAMGSLRPLMRGSHPRLDAASVQRAVRDDPHLALALVETEADALSAVARARVAEAVRVAEGIADLAAPSRGRGPAPKGFEAGYAYPLLDPTRYDDEDGEGYAYALVPEDAEPGRCHVHDAWIVDGRGRRHPGRAAMPVPVALDEVDLAAGRRTRLSDEATGATTEGEGTAWLER